jgi:hypothetical protein
MSDSPTGERRPHPKEAAALDLLHQNLSDTEISRRLHMDRTAIRRIRRAHQLPVQPIQPLTLVQKWAQRTRALPGGHLEWSGERATGSRTPVLRYKEQTFTAAAIAFRLGTGSDPQGYVRAECGLAHCVAPGHVLDAATRQRTREALRAQQQMRTPPASCRNGHDLAVHGRHSPDGRVYCQACNLGRKHAATTADSLETTPC